MHSLLYRFLAAILVLAGAACSLVDASGQGTRNAYLLQVDGAIGPAVGDYISRALETATEEGAELVVLRMDTPGGLDTSMRTIIKDINASEVPVVTFVAPSGARAASAGTYILYASHVAVMAPGTNLGAATPVQLGGLPDTGADKSDSRDEETKGDAEDKAAPKIGTGAGTKKLVNDAAAYIRGLAQLRGRNADWAEKAVREAASLPSEEALAEGVIDFIASDDADLLRKIHGHQVKVGGQEKTLDTQGLVLITLSPDWRSRLLSVISNPNVAYILMLIGIYGLIYEFSNPGAILPGTVGAIALLLALYAFQVLPINYTGAALILLGLALMVSEAFVPSFGALGIGGVAAFIIGSIILIDTEAPGFGISLPLILSLALVSAFILISIVGMALQSRRRVVVSGSEELLGASGYAVQAFDREGSVHIHGEIWKARTDRALAKGQPLRVRGREGLVLLVTPEDKEQE